MSVVISSNSRDLKTAAGEVKSPGLYYNYKNLHSGFSAALWFLHTCVPYNSHRLMLMRFVITRIAIRVSVDSLFGIESDMIIE